MKSVLLLSQIMFYLRIFYSQAQLGTRDVQKLDFEKVVFTSKKPQFMIFDVTRAVHYSILWYRGTSSPLESLLVEQRGSFESKSIAVNAIVKRDSDPFRIRNMWKLAAIITGYHDTRKYIASIYSDVLCLILCECV